MTTSGVPRVNAAHRVDLLELISRRQDELRGRPRNWRDDVSDWWRVFDLSGFCFTVVMSVGLWALVSIALAAGFVAWSAARADDMMRVPAACAPLAQRIGVPLVLSREQAAAALVALQQIQSDDAGVRRCRASLKPAQH
jgi:hypothetical protein